jgi:hypothetical protein
MEESIASVFRIGDAGDMYFRNVSSPNYTRKSKRCVIIQNKTIYIFTVVKNSNVMYADAVWCFRSAFFAYRKEHSLTKYENEIVAQIFVTKRENINMRNDGMMSKKSM